VLSHRSLETGDCGISTHEPSDVDRQHGEEGESTGHVGSSACRQPTTPSTDGLPKCARLKSKFPVRNSSAASQCSGREPSVCVGTSEMDPVKSESEKVPECARCAQLAAEKEALEAQLRELRDSFERFKRENRKFVRERVDRLMDLPTRSPK
jgi:hypothetical protein